MHFSGNGPYTKLCQDWLEKHLKCSKAFLTHSCTGALEMAAILCDIEPGDEVIMPSFTFVSTANAFVLRGAIPVFIDIREDTLNMNEELIEAAITSRTKAIVPVHYSGVSCEMDRIMEISGSNGIYVVEDAAMGMSSKYKNTALGTIGHAGCISFHETKNVSCGEGGALLINDERLIEKTEIIWHKGTDRNNFSRGNVNKYQWVDVGSSFMPSEITAAFLWAQLEVSQQISEKRFRLFKMYHDLLKPLEDQGIVRLPHVRDRFKNSCNIFYLITHDMEERSRLIKFLADNEIHAVFHYVPLHSSIGGRKYGRTNGEFTVTDHINERLLRLPLYNDMSEHDIGKVAETVKLFYHSN